MEGMIKLNDYLSDHAAHNMISILGFVENQIKSMDVQQIMTAFTLKTDLDYYTFMVDFNNYVDSYIKYEKIIKEAKKKDSRCS